MVPIAEPVPGFSLQGEFVAAFRPKVSRLWYYRSMDGEGRFRIAIRRRRDGSVDDAPWWEQVIGDGKWIVAARLVDQGGAPVFAEIRVFPNTELGPTGFKRASGEWSELEADVPPGGVKQRGILREIRLDVLARNTAEHMRRIADAKGEQAEGIRNVLTRSGARLEWAERRHPQGRPPLEEAELAKAAAWYLAKARDGQPAPVRRAAKALNIAETTLRERLKRARRRGILSPAQRGVAGGDLTARGRELVETIPRQDLPPRTEE